MNSWRRSLPLALALIAAPCAAIDEPASAAVLVETMKQARHSDGFEARLAITSGAADKAAARPVKVALIGQITAERRRFLVRGIAPERIRDRYVVAAQDAAGRVEAYEYGPHVAGPVPLDPLSRLFDSEFVIWDLFGAWWDWPQQALSGSGSVEDRDCQWVRSRPAVRSPIKEVASCVDRDRALALSTKIYDGQQGLLRTIRVDKLMRKGNGGGAMAKKMTVSAAHGPLTEIEVYGGDENYQVTPETFDVLERVWGR
ncbi:MAG: hypothetical protein HZC24_14555 [Rhodocyclales bacterium]|nr:hypothetical protein [Rhodocyclales bacterium]